MKAAAYITVFAAALPFAGRVSPSALSVTRARLSYVAAVRVGEATPFYGLGDAVAVDGNIAVAGAPFYGSGFADAFVRTGRTWRRTRLNNPNPKVVSLFGVAVAVSGTTMMIGSYGIKKIGYVYVYSLYGRAWRRSAAIADPHPDYGSGFGGSIALDGATAVIGDPSRNLAYVYTRKGNAWRLQGSLTDPGWGNQMGTEVAVSGSTAVVGDVDERVVAFVRHGTKWFMQGTLATAATEGYGDISVAISGNTAMAGRGIWDGGRGAVFVFTRVGRRWRATARFMEPHPRKSSNFGEAIALSGDRMIAGAPNIGSGRCGTAFEYIEFHDTWRLREVIANPGCSANDSFGAATALSGRTAVIGADGKQKGAGAVYELTVP